MNLLVGQPHVPPFHRSHSIANPQTVVGRKMSMPSVSSGTLSGDTVDEDRSTLGNGFDGNPFSMQALQRALRKSPASSNAAENSLQKVL